MGVAYSVCAAALWPSVALLVDTDKLGTAYGLMTALQNLGLAIAPLGAAYVINKASYAAGMTDQYIDPLSCSQLTVPCSDMDLCRQLWHCSGPVGDTPPDRCKEWCHIERIRRGAGQAQS